MKRRVVNSIDNDEADHCVDVFVRDDGTFGFEEYRRDHEDGRGWFSLDRYGTLVFPGESEALAQARSRVRWLAPEHAFEVRLAAVGDRDAIEALYRDCRRDADWLPANASRASLAQLSEGELIYVAIAEGGELEGFVSVWEPEPFVHHLYVREGSRRHGVAGALLAALVGKLSFPWRLKCVRANTAALDFYAKRGWRRIAEGVGSEGAYYELQLDRWLPE
jgi:GNAT superfamily N-acetyltransferase